MSNAVKYMATILALNLKVSRGTSNVKCKLILGDSQSVCTLQFDQFYVCTEMLTVLLCRMQITLFTTVFFMIHYWMYTN